MRRETRSRDCNGEPDETRVGLLHGAWMAGHLLITEYLLNRHPTWVSKWEALTNTLGLIPIIDNRANGITLFDKHF